MPRAAKLHAAGREAAKQTCRPKLPSPLSQSILTCTLAHARRPGRVLHQARLWSHASSRHQAVQERPLARSAPPARLRHGPRPERRAPRTPWADARSSRRPGTGGARAPRQHGGPLAPRALRLRALVLAALAVADAVVHERGGHAAPVRALKLRALRRGARRVSAARRRGRRACAMARTGQPGGLGEGAAGARAGNKSRSARHPRLPGPSAGARAQQAPRGRCTSAAAGGW